MKAVVYCSLVGLLLAGHQASSADKRVLYYGPTSGGVTMSAVPGIAPIGPGGSEVWFPGGIGSIPAGRDWNAANWSDFRQFDAVIFGDWVPEGHDIEPDAWEAAIDNRSVWSAALTGNMVILGTDPSSHAPSLPAAQRLFEQAMQFAASDERPGPGLYVAVGEAYAGMNDFARFELMACIGEFQVVGFHGGTQADPCEGDAVQVKATPTYNYSWHPVVEGFTDADLSWGGCSAHAGFGSWPGQFRPLAFATSVAGCKRTPGYFDDHEATDGYGAAYILATQPPLDGMTLSPSTVFGFDGEPVTFTAQYLDANGSPIVGVKVSFALWGRPFDEGACDPADCRTDTAGTVRWTRGAMRGIPWVHAFADINANGNWESTEPLVSSVCTVDFRILLSNPRITTVYPQASRHFTFDYSGWGDCEGIVEYSTDLITWSDLGFRVGPSGGEFLDWNHTIWECSWWNNCDPWVPFRGAAYYRVRSGLRRSNAIGYIHSYYPWRIEGEYDTYSLLSNPFNTSDNRLNNLLPGVPSGTTVYKMQPGGYWESSTYDGTEWEHNMTLNPGESIFLSTVWDASTEFMIMGEVPQGNLVTPVPAGWSGLASQVGQPGAIQTALKYEPELYETVYKYNNVGSHWDSFMFLGDSWEPSEPTLNIGEGFITSRSSSGAWVRDFSIWPVAPPTECNTTQAQITSPASGSAATGVLNVNAIGIDDVRTVGAILLVDGAKVDSKMFDSPYGFELHTTRIANGFHGVRVVTKDIDNHVNVST